MNVCLLIRFNSLVFDYMSKLFGMNNNNAWSSNKQKWIERKFSTCWVRMKIIIEFHCFASCSSFTEAFIYRGKHFYALKTFRFLYRFLMSMTSLIDVLGKTKNWVSFLNLNTSKQSKSLEQNKSRNKRTEVI